MNVRRPTKADRQRCKKCQYHTIMTGFNSKEIACLFILDVGRPRGCDFGVKCTEFVEGKVTRKLQTFLEGGHYNHDK
jgi:hypothetical protein